MSKLPTCLSGVFALQTVCKIDNTLVLSYIDLMPTRLDQRSLYTAIGERIRKHRIAYGLTQVQLAELLSLSRTSVTNIEKGRQKLLVHTLAEIASILEVDVSDLLPQMVPTEPRAIDAALPASLSETDRRFVTGLVAANPKEDQCDG